MNVRVIAFATVASFCLAFVPARGELLIEVVAESALPAKEGSRVMVWNPAGDGGGTTSLRFVSNRKANQSTYPPDGVTVFSKRAREHPQRDRDLGQTFRTGDNAFRVHELFLRVGPSEKAVQAGAPGARVAVQWFEVAGAPRLNDHGTPGFLGKFDRAKAPELDDYLDGETFKPLRAVEGRLPAKLTANDCLKLTFRGDDALRLEAQRDYAFLLLFTERGADRSLALANQYYGRYRPDPRNKYAGHGIRREGAPAFPDDWRARVAQPPGTLGFPDVCTFRDLYFIVTRQ